MFSLDGYRALRTDGGVVRRTDRAVLSITGADRAAWLQGLVTNDVVSLAPNETRYAAYLTPQGRMITDLNVTARADRLLLDVPSSLAASLRDRLDGLIFAEDAQVIDSSATLDVWSSIGPNDGDITDVIVEAGQPHGVSYPEINLDTFEVVRIERGIPRFLADMDTETIPLEAGIEDRAISFTKGCYVGQEVIVRVTHRGGGRVAKKLVHWQAVGQPTGGDKPSVWSVMGARIFAADRDIGRVTSAAFSPDRGAVVGLGYVHRDFVDPGSEVTVVWNDARSKVTIR